VVNKLAIEDYPNNRCALDTVNAWNEPLEIAYLLAIENIENGDIRHFGIAVLE